MKNTRKDLFKVLLLTLCTALLCLGAAAAEPQTVYVTDGGTGDGSSALRPLGSLSAALSALGGKGGRIVVCGDLTVANKTTIADQSGDLTFTAENGGKLVLKNRLQFAKNKNDNLIILDLPIDIAANYACYMFGGFNSITFTSNFSVTASGGSKAAFAFYGGVHAGEATSIQNCLTTLPYAITVNGGTFSQFAGGNLRLSNEDYVGSIAAPITVTIGGGTFGVAGDYSKATAPNKEFDAFSVSGMSILADSAALNISGGTFHTPIYLSGRCGKIVAAASQSSAFLASDKKYYVMDGDIAVNITGGTFNGGAVCDTYADAGYTQVLRGNYTVNISGSPVFKSGTVFDATQVKAYAGESKKQASPILLHSALP